MTQPSAPLDAVLARLDADMPAALERLMALMRIRSISTDPAFASEVRRGAEFMRAELSEIGFDSRIVESTVGGHPFVVASHAGPSDPEGSTPHVLFYGHYDVQPVDPLNLWTSDPFAPALETRADGSQLIRGRGSSDDKAQLKTFVEACRAWKSAPGGLPCRVTVFLEGEEESGSKSMPAFLRDHGAELQADCALICDTSMWNASTPAITLSLRGMAAGAVAGAAALVLGQHPDWSPAQVRDELVAKADTRVVRNPGRNSPDALLCTSFLNSPAGFPNSPAGATSRG